MLFKIDPKAKHENVKQLRAKLTKFISAKMPIIQRWAWNELYMQGIDRKALEWRFNRIPSREMVDYVDEAGKKTGEKGPRDYYTLEEIKGTYSYNMRGVPTKVTEYLEDGCSREINVDVNSTSLLPTHVNFCQKVLQEGMINDTEWLSSVRKKKRDILVKGKAFDSVESFDLTRKVRTWKELGDKAVGGFVWDEAAELPYKRGVFVEYIDPEWVFPEPGTLNPTEFFVGKPYTYSEFILNFPDLYDKAVPGMTDMMNIARYKKTDMIYPETLFPYQIDKPISALYHNWREIDNPTQTLFCHGQAGIPWLNDIWNLDSKGFSLMEKTGYDHKIWVWKYYHLAHNPIPEKDKNGKEKRNTSGDFCCIFVNDWQLYAGPILEADKNAPLVAYSFKEDRLDYWNKSMVDELRPIQDNINDMENVKRTSLDNLSTTNLAVNKKLIESDIVLDRHMINIVNIETEQDKEDQMSLQQQGPLNVGNVIQNMQLGNPAAVSLSKTEIIDKLGEMDELYPKPIYKIQLLPAQAQIQTHYSSNPIINNLNKNFNDSQSKVGEKFLKETLGFIRYVNVQLGEELNQKAKKKGEREGKEILRAVGLAGLPIIVAKDFKQMKQISLEKKIDQFIEYKNQMDEEQRQTQQQSLQAETGQNVEIPELPKLTKKQVMANKELVKSIEAEVPDDNVYFVFEDLIMQGTDDLQVKISFDKTRQELVQETQEFITIMANLGTYIDNSVMAEKLALLFNQNLKVLDTNPPDQLTQTLLRNFRINSNLYPEGSMVQKIYQKFAGLTEEETKFNPNNPALMDWVTKTVTAHQLGLESAEETSKVTTKAKAAFEQIRKQINTSPETQAENNRMGDVAIAGEATTVIANPSAPAPEKPKLPETERLSNSENVV